MHLNIVANRPLMFEICVRGVCEITVGKSYIHTYDVALSRTGISLVVLDLFSSVKFKEVKTGYLTLRCRIF